MPFNEMGMSFWGFFFEGGSFLHLLMHSWWKLRSKCYPFDDNSALGALQAQDSSSAPSVKHYRQNYKIVVSPLPSVLTSFNARACYQTHSRVAGDISPEQRIRDPNLVITVPTDTLSPDGAKSSLVEVKCLDIYNISQFQYPMRQLILRIREISMPRDW